MPDQIPPTIQDAQMAALDPPPGPVTASLHTGGASGGCAAAGTVYIVTTGSYSDYHVDRVFAREADAAAYAALHRDGDAAVEAYAVAERVPAHRTCHQMAQSLTSPTALAPLEDYSWRVFEGEPEYDWTRPRVDVWPAGAEDALGRPRFWQIVRVVVRCTDRDLALKALHDRVAAIQARAAGL